MEAITNYSRSSITEVLKNFEQLEVSNPVTSRDFSLRLDFGLSTNQLKLQSEVFASNYIMHGNQNLEKILRVRSDKLKRTLKEIYIYSFSKALFNGYFCHDISETSYLGIMLAGHAEYYRLLINNSNRELVNGFVLSYYCNKDELTTRKARFLRLLSAFKFLISYEEMRYDKFGSQPFLIEKYETYLNLLSEDYYSKPNINQSVKSLQEKGLEDLGSLNLVKVRSDDPGIISEFSNSPIMNGFSSHDFKKYFFITVNNNKPVINNSSFFFSKANFIKLPESNKLNNFEMIDQVYNFITIDRSKEHLVCSEVYTISGIHCSYFGTVSGSESSSGKIKIPSTRRIVEFINSGIDKASTINDILNAIKDSEPDSIDDPISGLIEGPK